MFDEVAQPGERFCLWKQSLKGQQGSREVCLGFLIVKDYLYYVFMLIGPKFKYILPLYQPNVYEALTYFPVFNYFKT